MDSSGISKKNNNTATNITASDLPRRIVCGGLAGMIAKTATAPLERIKMISQTGEHGLGHKNTKGLGKHTAAEAHSVINLFRNVLRNEGVVGLWAGNGANLLRIFPAKGVVFACNDFYRRWFYQALVPNADIGMCMDPPAYVSFLTGGFAGMSATAVTYPLDFARGRISGKVKLKTTMGSAIPQNAYHGTWNTIMVSVKEEGIRALYKGVTPTLLGAIPYEGIKFGTVGVLEHLFPHTTNHHQDGTNTKPSAWRKVIFGAAGGVMAGLITYPNDTVRRMLQLQGSRGTTDVYTGYWDCVRKTYRNHGVQRFYHGLGINLIRMAPNTAVQFGSYEVLKQLTEKMF